MKHVERPGGSHEGVGRKKNDDLLPVVRTLRRPFKVTAVIWRPEHVLRVLRVSQGIQ